MIKEITFFDTEDGSRFSTKAEAEAHAAKINEASVKYYEKYLKTKEGMDLFSRYHDKKTFWCVYGESGDFSAPILGYVFGTVETVLKWATKQTRWATYGAGGRLVDLSVQFLDFPDQ